MKKTWYIVLSLLLVLSFAACKKQPQAAVPTPAPTDAPTDMPTDAPSTEPTGPQDGQTDDLSSVLEQVYDKTPSLEVSLGPTAAVDLTDANAVKTYLGLDAADGISEAVFSEPMMSSIAYSVCLVRVSDTADTAALMRAMVDGVDPRKWICVEAESVSAVSSGDLILLVMTEPALSDAIFASFSEVVGEATVSAPVVRGK